MKMIKGATTKHHQLATTGHAEGLCHGGRPMKTGGRVMKHGGEKQISQPKGKATMSDSAKEMHHHVNVKHEKGVKHHVHIHHH